MRTVHKTMRLVVSAAMLIALAGCSTEKQEGSDPRAGVALTITFHGKSNGDCKPTVDPEIAHAQRKQWVHWQVSEIGCSGFSLDKVKLVFDDNVVKTKEAHVVNGTIFISAKISADKKDADDKAHTYSVFYDDKKAGDPEIDVLGDCPTCTL